MNRAVAAIAALLLIIVALCAWQIADRAKQRPNDFPPGVPASFSHVVKAELGEPKVVRRYARIVAWSLDDKGKLNEVYILADGDADTHKLIWMEIGKKVILPNWYTFGKEAQALRSDKIEQAWNDGTPGVYKMDYSAPIVRQKVFAGYIVEVSK